jgi:hypothetical protein
MPDHAAPSSPLPQDWEAILETMQSRLLEALGAMGPASGPLPAAAEVGPVADKRQELDRLAGDLLKGEHAERARAIAEEADQLLAATEAALERKLADAESLRQRLTAWLARTVSAG